MFKLLFIHFIIKLYARNDILKFITRKHEQNVITVSAVLRSLEQMQTK